MIEIAKGHSVSIQVHIISSSLRSQVEVAGNASLAAGEAATRGATQRAAQLTTCLTGPLLILPAHHQTWASPGPTSHHSCVKMTAGGPAQVQFGRSVLKEPTSSAL